MGSSPFDSCVTLADIYVALHNCTQSRISFTENGFKTRTISEVAQGVLNDTVNNTAVGVTEEKLKSITRQHGLRAAVLRVVNDPENLRRANPALPIAAYVIGSVQFTALMARKEITPSELARLNAPIAAARTPADLLSGLMERIPVFSLGGQHRPLVSTRDGHMYDSEDMSHQLQAIADLERLPFTQDVERAENQINVLPSAEKVRETTIRVFRERARQGRTNPNTVPPSILNITTRVLDAELKAREAQRVAPAETARIPFAPTRRTPPVAQRTPEARTPRPIPSPIPSHVTPPAERRRSLPRWLLPAAGAGTAFTTLLAAVVAGFMHSKPEVAQKLIAAGKDASADTDITFEDVSQAVDLTPDQQTKMVGLLDRADTYMIPFVDGLMGASSIGVLNTGEISKDPVALQASLAETRDRLAYVIVNNQVKGYYPMPGREKDITYGQSFARYHCNGTADSADDVMVIDLNNFFKTLAYRSETSMHEEGHWDPQTNRPTHSDGAITRLDRDSKEFMQECLSTADYSYYLTALFGVEEKLIGTYIGWSLSNALRDGTWTHPTGKAEKAMLNDLATTYMKNNSVLEPVGVTKDELLATMTSTHFMEIANAEADLKIIPELKKLKEDKKPKEAKKMR